MNWISSWNSTAHFVFQFFGTNNIQIYIYSIFAINLITHNKSTTNKEINFTHTNKTTTKKTTRTKTVKINLICRQLPITTYIAHAIDTNTIISMHKRQRVFNPGWSLHFHFINAKCSDSIVLVLPHSCIANVSRNSGTK